MSIGIRWNWGRTNTHEAIVNLSYKQDLRGRDGILKTSQIPFLSACCHLLGPHPRLSVAPVLLGGQLRQNADLQLHSIKLSRLICSSFTKFFWWTWDCWLSKLKPRTTFPNIPSSADILVGLLPLLGGTLPHLLNHRICAPEQYVDNGNSQNFFLSTTLLPPSHLSSSRLGVASYNDIFIFCHGAYFCCPKLAHCLLHLLLVAYFSDEVDGFLHYGLR